MKSVFVHRRGAGFFRTGPADGFGEGLPSAHVTEAAGALRLNRIRGTARTAASRGAVWWQGPLFVRQRATKKDGPGLRTRPYKMR